MDSICEETTISTLALPENRGLPFFTYGAFMPGELAFSQIEKFLNKHPVPAKVKGHLMVRDGLPLLDPDIGEVVNGYLLSFKDESCNDGYQAICNFEPRKIYFWRNVTLLEPQLRANLLVGKSLNQGGAKPFEGSSWSFRCDPVFEYGILVVKEMSNDFAKEPFEGRLSEDVEWSRFFKLQMAYLLLWSAIERFSAFAYGPALGPEEKIKRLGGDQRFEDALKGLTTSSTGLISDSRDLTAKKSLSPDNPVKSAQYYYQIRNNLIHRGKGAGLEAEVVRNGLNELLQIFERMVSATEQEHASAKDKFLKV